ncbi:MAG: SURF1 family protein [Gemmatimonadetes bacterium]|nr:SURF1 family protein [Gemmatimonadota bacterium]
MQRRHIWFILIATLAALGMVRLGVWQLSRLGERRAFNATLRSRLDSGVVRPEALPTDTALVRYRRVRLDGVYDAEHEMQLTARSRNGSPGVFLVTPLRRPGRDTAILVVRGWVYSPNAKDVADLARWRSGAVANVAGFADTYPIGNPGTVLEPGKARAIRRLDLGELAKSLPYPIAPYYVMLLRDPAAAIDSTAPVAFVKPAVDDDGPHKSYAIQWFSFALISVIGTIAFVRSDVRKARA